MIQEYIIDLLYTERQQYGEPINVWRVRVAAKLCDLMTKEIIEEPRLKKIEVKNGALNVELEAEEIVRFYAEHMKQLFDSVKGADNYYTLDMKFVGDGKYYTITFQKNPGKTIIQTLNECQDERDKLKKRIEEIENAHD